MDFWFNTNRLYTEKGQYIRVRYDESTGVALFADVSRLVDGRVIMNPGLSEAQVRAMVLYAYDEGAYSRSKESLEFLWQAEGAMRESNP